MQAKPPTEAADRPDAVDANKAATAISSATAASPATLVSSATAARSASSAGAASSATASQRWQWRVTLLFAVLILIPSGYGFIGKFVELVNLFRNEAGGEFAVAPILNYLLASLGFFCMLVWAVVNGMFHDVERPKVALLEHEQLLDHPTKEDRR
jgi:hypothetical protein